MHLHLHQRYQHRFEENKWPETSTLAPSPSTPASADGSTSLDQLCLHGWLLVGPTLAVTGRRPIVSFYIHARPQAGGGPVHGAVRLC